MLKCTSGAVGDGRGPQVSRSRDAVHVHLGVGLLYLDGIGRSERVLIERVRIGWRLERVDKERQGVKLLVAVAKERRILAAKIAKPRNGSGTARLTA